MGGFDLSSLKSATNQESLSDACTKLRQFLSSFLIPDDALVASFAVLQNSVYDRRPDLRKDSGCFTEVDLETLRTKMGPQFVFSDHSREEMERRDRLIEARMLPIRTALLSQNPALIQKNIADPIDKFDIAFSKNKKDYFLGNPS